MIKKSNKKNSAFLFVYCYLVFIVVFIIIASEQLIFMWISFYNLTENYSSSSHSRNIY